MLNGNSLTIKNTGHMVWVVDLKSTTPSVFNRNVILGPVVDNSWYSCPSYISLITLGPECVAVDVTRDW